MGTISFRRKAVDRTMTALFCLAAILVILPLFLIFFDMLIKGGKELKLTLLIDLPHPVGEPGGGIANGIVGTLVITLMTMLWSVPTAVLSLGGTRWEMLRIVIGQHCIPGIFGATILGLGRALGETMAVTMVIGNRPEAILSLFQPGYTMAAVIANEFTEAVGDVYLSSLILIGLILFAMTFAVNLAAKWILTKMVARASRGI